MKKTKQTPFLWLAPIILTVIGTTVIPLLNLFLLQMPEWITIIAAAAILTAAVVMWIRLKKKIAPKIIISFFSLLGICISLFSSFCNPYWNGIYFKSDNSLYYCKGYDYELTYGQAKSDLDYAFKYLKKLHPAFYKEIPAEIERQYDKAVSNLKNADKITVNSLAAEVQAICYPLKDAHTNVSLNYTDERYMKYIYSHNQAGDILWGINGQSLESLLEEGSACYGKVSFEVSSWGAIRLKNYLSTLEGLDYLGIPTNNGITYNYESEGGEKTEQFAEETDFLPYEEYVKFNNITDNTAEETSFVSYTIDKDKNAAVLTLDECNYNSEYINALKSMFAEIKAEGIENVAVDLRENGGGNSLVANEFIRYLDTDSYKEGGLDWRLGCFMLNFPDQVSQNDRYEDLLFKGNVYVITSSRSFSSAMLFAQFVKDNGLGRIIGEPAANNPNGYGDISIFRLPNSGATIQISTKRFSRIDNKEGLIEPDIPCKADQALDHFYKAASKP